MSTTTNDDGWHECGKCNGTGTTLYQAELNVPERPYLIDGITLKKPVVADVLGEENPTRIFYWQVSCQLCTEGFLLPVPIVEVLGLEAASKLMTGVNHIGEDNDEYGH